MQLKHLFFLFLFVSFSLAFKLPSKFLNRKQNSYSSGSYADVSNCGNTNCTTSAQWCPPFPFADQNCVNGYCEYTPHGSSNFCTSLNECGTGNCICPNATKSVGCKCSTADDCDSLLCIDGQCKNNGGYIGSYCNEDFDCNNGFCYKDNTCQFRLDGAACNESRECRPESYCDTDSKTCVQRPLCNKTTDDNIGYCPNSGICRQGKCYPVGGLGEGEQCLYPQNCFAGLACLPSSNGSMHTCQSVPLGTPCNYSEQCAFLSEDCLCMEPENSEPTRCMDAGYYKCTEEYQKAVACFVSEGCDYYDVNDPTTDCSKKCLPLINAFSCCSVCRYPEFSDNAFFNMAGSCADNTAVTVNCCSDSKPCSVLSIGQLCLNYK